MRDAALMIAALRDDYAPSLATRALRALAGLATALRRRWIARRHLAQLRRLDPHRLDDLGLTPDDLAGLDPALPALAATEALAARVAARRADERWSRV